LPYAIVVKRILQSCIGGLLLLVLNVLAVWIASSVQLANGRPMPLRSLDVIGFPLIYGVRLNKRFFSPEVDNSFALLRWSDVVASFVGAFLLFGLLTYIFLFWRSRRLRAT
jgi:hypothetical protein